MCRKLEQKHAHRNITNDAVPDKIFGIRNVMPQDKMPQCQKRTKCHNVDGEIRMHQKCYKDVTKVLIGCNMV